MTGDDDHGQMRPRLGQTGLNFETVHARHVQIEHHTMRLAGRQGIQEFGARRKGLCPQAGRTHQPKKCAPNALFVVDDGDERWWLGDGALP